MERKTKHRILGILVILGLVILALPFLQGEKNLSNNAEVIKAPPFPDQALQVTPPDEESKPANPNPSKTTSVNNDSGEREPQDLLQTVHPTVINQPGIIENKTNTLTQPEENNVNLPEAYPESKATTTELTPAIEKKAVLMRQAKESHTVGITKKGLHSLNTSAIHLSANKKKSLLKQPKHASTDNNDLYQLKNTTWVIQMGNFKNKANAIRLVNQLRANGYRAFIREVASGSGMSTRVFVGPESKKKAAHLLAQQLEKDIHIQGFVISYKPLIL